MEKTILTKICGAGHFSESPQRKSKYLTSTLTWFILVCLFLTLTSTLTFANTIGKITAVEGNVDIMKPGQERVVPGRLLEPVSEGDIVRTKSSGKAEITFDDESIIRLAPNTRLQITEYLMEGSKRKSGIMNLFRGKIRAVVSKSRKIIGIAFGEGERFEVRTPTAVAGVKGTDFFVFHQMDITSVVVLEGRIDTFNVSMPEQVVMVATGYTTIITRDKPPQKPRPTHKVEKIRHMKDTDPAEKPKDKDDEDETMVAAATAEGVFGYEAPDEETSLTASAGAADAEPDALPVTETHPELLADIIPPSITLNSSAFPEAGNLTSAIFLFSSNEPATYSYNLINVTDGTSSGWTSAPGTSLTFTGLLENSYILDVQATDAAGNVSTPASLSFDLSRYSLSGTAVLTSNGVPDIGTAIGEIAGVSNQNWGGYSMNLSGPWWEGGSSTYTLIAGGLSTDNTAPLNDSGYWIETISNAVDGGGTFSGTSNLIYLSYDRLGKGTGTVNGSYSSAWSTTYSGAYTETPLAWSGEIDYDYNDAGLYSNSVDGIINVGDTYNFGNNLVGGVQLPWSGTTSLTMMGQYVGPLSTDIGPFMWNAPIYSGNFSNGYLTSDGGAFWGINGGIWRDVDGNSATTNDRTIKASLYSLYIDPLGNAGILKGNLTGSFYPELSMFSADGTWTPTILATGFNPTVLGSLTYFPDLTWSTFGLAGTGSFAAGGTISEGQTEGLRYSMPGTAPGEGWGVWQALTAGGYSGTTSDAWNFLFTDVGFLGSNIIGTQTDGTQWSNGAISGTTYAYGADIIAAPMTWIGVGETIGTFDPNAWQAVQTGAWLETTKFLGMIAAGKTTELTALNIPFAEVGKTTLSGSGNNINVSMNNVTFFAYQTGDAPKIWATDSVTGTYAVAAPIIDQPVTLSGNIGTNTLSADFIVKQWGGVVGTSWSATVENGNIPVNTMNNTSQMTFEGAAAGTIDTTIDFSGTAAGAAQ